VRDGIVEEFYVSLDGTTPPVLAFLAALIEQKSLPSRRRDHLLHSQAGVSMTEQTDEPGSTTESR